MKLNMSFFQMGIKGVKGAYGFIKIVEKLRKYLLVLEMIINFTLIGLLERYFYILEKEIIQI